ncbi:MAG: hypothetical protein KF870_01180 [Leadbetterella sp.]|nr:hypothetical protein [Leadbetterella sp.]
MLLKVNIRLGHIISGTWKNLFFSIITCTFAYSLNELWLSKYFEFPSFVPSLIGTALAFFIGFNNNQAYSRWWEARTVWGSLVNNSRSWARQLLNYTQASDTLSEAKLKEIRETLIKRHMAFLYALKAHLRGSDDDYYRQYLAPGDLASISGQTNLHNAILNLQSGGLQELYAQKAIDGFGFMELNRTVTTFCDDMGRCERIRNTVFPTTYTYYSRNFIWLFIYAVTMAIGSAIGVWAIVFGAITGYIFFTIQSLGQTLVNPFEKMPSALPLDQISRTIEINLLQMLGEKDVPTPVESVNGEYIL